MKNTSSRKKVLAFQIVLAFGIVTANAQENEWKIGARTLPASGGVSDVMYEALINTTLGDVDEAKETFPKSAEEWKSFATERDSVAANTALLLAERLSVDIVEDKIAGVVVHRVIPSIINPEHKNHRFVYIHGGAWVLNGGKAGTIEPVLIAAHLGIPVISIDYRMPPDYPAPAAVDDAVAVWIELLKKWSPSTLALGGTSAGGNISLSAIHRMRELQLPFPGALYVGTPCVEIDNTGDSRFINEGIDRVLLTWEGIPIKAGKLYAGDMDLKSPFLSPIFGQFDNFPPSYVISGTRDLLLSDAVRVHREIRRAGVEADLHIYEGQSHADFIAVMNAPESAEHYAELSAFLVKHLSRPLTDDPGLSTKIGKDILIPSSTVF